MTEKENSEARAKEFMDCIGNGRTIYEIEALEALEDMAIEEDEEIRRYLER